MNSASESSNQTTNETFQFKAEISQLLSIIINNFYSEKDIFLRELISNASDAIDKVRYQHLQNPESNILGDNNDFKITIVPDIENKALIIQDTGVGMTRDDLINNLGTIAHSGTKQFMDNLTQGGDMSLIGKFGVGFYSAFLVADHVDVYSRHYSSPDTHVWSSNAEGSFSVNKVEDTDMTRGTRLVLHLRDDQLRFLEELQLREIVGRHSQFVSYPIYLQVIKTKEAEIDEEQNEEYTVDDEEIDLDNQEQSTENNEEQSTNEEQQTSPVTEQEGGESNDVILDGEEEMERFNLEEKADEPETEPEPEPELETYTEFEVLNKSVPIWMKSKNEVSEEDYNEFYKTISGDWDEPLTHIHFQVEGNIEMKGLFYIPKKAPFDLFQSRQQMNNIKLYVRRVFITDECQKFVPDYLSFVKGVVDSNDLPLNVSREMLQYKTVFEGIKKSITRKVIDMLVDLADDEEKYNTFYREFSKNIKLGVHEDADKRQKLARLLRYTSTKSSGGLTSLDKYIENMKEGQHDIYYITGENMESVATSTHLDIFRNKDVEVLFMTEAIDEYCVSQLSSYKEHNLVNVTRQNIELPESEEEKKQFEEKKVNYKELCEAIQKVLSGNVSSVTVSNRLVQEPCCVSVGQHGWTANMEKIMKAQAMSDNSMLSFMQSQRCFEINPEHPIIKSLYETVSNSNNEMSIGTTNLVNLLYETALYDAGFSVKSPRNYAHRVYSMVELGLGIPPQSHQEHTTEDVDDELPDLGESECSSCTTCSPESVKPSDTEVDEMVNEL